MWAFCNKSCVSTHIVRFQRNGSVGICTIRSVSWSQRHCCYEDEETHSGTRTRNGSFRVFVNQESRKRIGHRQALDVYSRRLHRAMAEVNVEGENPRSYNPWSRNPIGSTVSVYRIPKRSRLRYRLSFNTLDLPSLSRFLLTFRSFASVTYSGNPIHNSEIQMCALSILVIWFIVLLFLHSLSHTLFHACAISLR